MYYGWKARIGLIMPSTGSASERDFHKWAPEGVEICTTRVLFEKVDHDGLIEMGNRVEQAAKLISTSDLDIIVFACTTGSLIKGLGYDEELTTRIQCAANVPAITTSGALLQALRTIGSKKLSIATPYSKQVDQAEKKFLEDNGYEVLDIQGLEFTDPRKMPMVTPDQMYHMAKRVNHQEADTVFLSCTGLGIIDYIPMYEQDLSKPVLTSNQVTLWAALRHLGINDKLPLGHLFQL